MQTWLAFGWALIRAPVNTPVGKTLDVYHRRGVVEPRCNLPWAQRPWSIAASHALFEGGRWCDSDYGHTRSV